MANPQNANGVYNNPVTNQEPTNLCCYKTVFPTCLSSNIFLTTTVIETPGANPNAGSLVNIANALRGIERAVNLIALDSDVTLTPPLTTAQKTDLSNLFKQGIAK